MGTSIIKRRPERKNKRNWRKNVDTTDLDNFLDDKRLDERLGLKNKKDSELFVLDTDDKPLVSAKKGRSREEKKKWAREPSYYEKLLIPQSAVNDPIKRNRVRTKEERAGYRKPKPGVLRRIEEGMHQRRTHFANLRLKQRREKEVTFEKDLWKDDDDVIDTTWFTADTAKTALTIAGAFKVKPPKRKRLPEVTPIEDPHPGISYNPSLADHRNLLEQVAEREREDIRKEEHLKRVLSAPKLTHKQLELMWMTERMSGLSEDNQEEKEEVVEVEKENSEVKKNPPVTRDGKKTLKQRRRLREMAQEAQKRAVAKVEKKKLSDIYKLRAMSHSIREADERANVNAEKRRKVIDAKRRFGIERLSRLKYEEPPQELLCPHELAGSLRRTANRPAAILKDRFASLQRRNMLAPSKLTAKTKKRVVKRFVKATHRLADAEKEHHMLHENKGSPIKNMKKKNNWKVQVFE